MITVPKEKSPLFNFVLEILKEIGHIEPRKNHGQELRSPQYLGYHENRQKKKKFDRIIIKKF